MALKFDKYSEDGKIICQICGAPYLRLSATHLATHNMTMEKYKKLYPEAPVFSERFRIQNKNIKKTLFLKEEEDVIPKNEPIPIKEAEELFGKSVSGVPQTEKTVHPVDNRYKFVHEEKVKLLLALEKMFPKIVNNYIIEKRNHEDSILFQIVTDIADPLAKTVFEFPKAFWRNNDPMDPQTRKKYLKEEGWLVHTITSPHPKIEDISSVLDMIVECE